MEFASQYGRYGYRRITALLKRDGWQVGKDRVKHFSTPATKTRRRGLRYLATCRTEGSAEAKAARASVVQRWIVRAAAAGAREPRMVLRLREREDARRKYGADAEPDRRAQPGVPADPCRVAVEFGEGDRSAGRRDGDEGCAGASRSDNGPEFVTRNLRKWLAGTGAKTAYIEPGSPWENGYCESFNSKAAGRVSERRDFLLDERAQCAGGALASPLQHCPATLLAGLQTSSPVAWLSVTTWGMEKWEPLRASHFSTPPTAAI